MNLATVKDDDLVVAIKTTVERLGELTREAAKRNIEVDVSMIDVTCTDDSVRNFVYGVTLKRVLTEAL